MCRVHWAIFCCYKMVRPVHLKGSSKISWRAFKQKKKFLLSGTFSLLSFVLAAEACACCLMNPSTSKAGCRNCSYKNQKVASPEYSICQARQQAANPCGISATISYPGHVFSFKVATSLSCRKCSSAGSGEEVTRGSQSASLPGRSIRSFCFIFPFTQINMFFLLPLSHSLTALWIYFSSSPSRLNLTKMILKPSLSIKLFACIFVSEIQNRHP